MRKIAISLILMLFVLASVFAAEDNLTVKLTVTDDTVVKFTAKEYNFSNNQTDADPSHEGFSSFEENGGVKTPLIVLTEPSYKATIYASARTNSSEGFVMKLTYTDLTSGEYTIPLNVTYKSTSVDLAVGNDPEDSTTSGSSDTAGKAITLNDPTTSFGLRAISHQIELSVDSVDVTNAAYTQEDYKATLTLDIAGN